MIIFETNEKPGYRDRTIQNASADVTIAFAHDFESAGEKLTKKAVLEQGKIYIPIKFENLTNSTLFIRYVMSCREPITFSEKGQSGEPITLNIAGNGLYTLRNSDINTQPMIDEIIYRFMDTLVKAIKPVQIQQIRTGGQSGVDEAGAKAGVRLGIPTLVHAPNDWVYRDGEGNDHYGEDSFKKRFEK